MLRVDVSYDPSMVTARQHGTWMDEDGFKKTCMMMIAFITFKSSLVPLLEGL